jgi:SAM-dependent methyltransferase
MNAENPVAPARDYDEFVDWNKRLDREGPFFRELFDREGVHRLIDVGAGSARHAIMFASWGLEVIAVDPGESMLAQARVNAERFSAEIEAGGGSLKIVEGGFGELHRLGLGAADAITCTGNALPHVNGRDGLTEALADFASVLVPGGVLVLHLLNHARLLHGKPRAIAPKVVENAEGTKVFVRVIDYPRDGEFLDFDFVTLVRDPEGVWEVSSRRSAHTAIPLSLLRSELPCAGFSRIEAFGGHDGHPLTDDDESLVLVARRS